MATEGEYDEGEEYGYAEGEGEGEWEGEGYDEAAYEGEGSEEGEHLEEGEGEAIEGDDTSATTTTNDEDRSVTSDDDSSDTSQEETNNEIDLISQLIEEAQKANINPTPQAPSASSSALLEMEPKISEQAILLAQGAMPRGRRPPPRALSTKNLDASSTLSVPSPPGSTDGSSDSPSPSTSSADIPSSAATTNVA